MPLPAVPFDAVDWVACKTDGYGKVTIGRTKDSPDHKYLADPPMPETEVIVGVRAYEVEIGTLAGERLRTCTRRFGADFTDDENPVAVLDVLVSQDPRVPDVERARDACRARARTPRRHAVQGPAPSGSKTMARVAREHGIETCAAALEDTLAATGATAPSDVEVTAARISCAGRRVPDDGAGKLIMYDDLMRRKVAGNG